MKRLAALTSGRGSVDSTTPWLVTSQCLPPPVDSWGED